jgi:hypothetical protein
VDGRGGFFVSDLLADGAAWLAGQFKTAAGRTVTYRRGNDETAVTATVGRSQFESQNQSGVIENWESRDYLVTYGDLPYGEPMRGDVIVEELSGEVLEYEVASPRGVPVFHFGDAFRSIVRVHTTQIDSGVTFLVTESGEQLLTESGDLLVA